MIALIALLAFTVGAICVWCHYEDQLQAARQRIATLEAQVGGDVR